MGYFLSVVDVSILPDFRPVFQLANESWGFPGQLSGSILCVVVLFGTVCCNILIIRKYSRKKEKVHFCIFASLARICQPKSVLTYNLRSNFYTYVSTYCSMLYLHGSDSSLTIWFIKLVMVLNGAGSTNCLLQCLSLFGTLYWTHLLHSPVSTWNKVMKILGQGPLCTVRALNAIYVPGTGPFIR